LKKKCGTKLLLVKLQMSNLFCLKKMQNLLVWTDS